MNAKPTRRDFLRLSAAGALVGGVSLLVLKPRDGNCAVAFDCQSCSLDPARDQACPRFGETESQAAQKTSSDKTLEKEADRA